MNDARRGGAAPGLSPSALLILLALADGPRHGLGIIDDVEARSGGRIRIGPGTLYGTLKRIREEGLIDEIDTPPDPADDDPRRRYYQIRREGLAAVRAEAERLEALVRFAREKRVLPSPARP
jgi:DNA-binding PadR family transcriptional regulator